MSDVKVRTKQTRALSHTQFYQLTEHMKSTRDLFEGRTASHVASACQAALGFKISPTSIRDAAPLARVGLREQGGAPDTGKTYRSNRALAKALILVCTEVRTLQESLGMPSNNINQADAICKAVAYGDKAGLVTALENEGSESNNGHR